MKFLDIYNITSPIPASTTQEALPSPKLVSPLKNDELSIPSLAPNLSDLCDDDDRDDNEVVEYRYTPDQESVSSDVYSDDDDEEEDEAMSSSSEQSSIDDDDDNAAYDRYANVNCGAPTYLKSYPRARLGTVETLIGLILRVRSVEDAVSQVGLLQRIIQNDFKTRASEREWADLLMVGGAQAVLCAMRRFPHEHQVRLSGAAILSAMAESHEPSRIQIAASGGAELLLSVVSDFQDEHGSTVWVASWALRNLLMRRREGRSLKVDRRCVEFATEADGIQILVETLGQYGGDASICYVVCCCLSAMTASSIGNIMQARQAGAVRALNKAGELFRNVPVIWEQTESLLYHLNSVRGVVRRPHGMA